MLDQSPHQLARAEAKPALARCAKLLGDAEDLPFPTDPFDRYVSAGSIEYWPEPQRAIAEAYRVLRPGGTAAPIGPVRPGNPLLRRLAETWMLFPDRGPIPRLVQRRGIRRRRAARARPRLVPEPARPLRRGVSGNKPRAGPSPLRLPPPREDARAPLRPAERARVRAPLRGRFARRRRCSSRSAPRSRCATGCGRARDEPGGQPARGARRGAPGAGRRAVAVLAPAHDHRHRREHRRPLRDRRRRAARRDARRRPWRPGLDARRRLLRQRLHRRRQPARGRRDRPRQQAVPAAGVRRADAGGGAADRRGLRARAVALALSPGSGGDRRGARRRSRSARPTRCRRCASSASRCWPR